MAYSKNLFNEQSVNDLIDILPTKNIPFEIVQYYDIVSGKVTLPDEIFFPFGSINLIKRLKRNKNALI